MRVGIWSKEGPRTDSLEEYLNENGSVSVTIEDMGHVSCDIFKFFNKNTKLRLQEILKIVHPLK